jgi:DNA-binding transcriptional MerR regulator
MKKIPPGCRDKSSQLSPLYLRTRLAYHRGIVSEIATYSIGAVARMVGVPPATLRTWEDRYGVVQPVRSEGGHRLYSRQDVERLRFVAERVREGISPGDAHRLLSGASGNLPLPAGDAGERIVILLAERDPYAAEFAEYFLKTEGFEVVLAMDAADAADALAADRPQLAVVDLLISGGSGLELCRNVHARGIPVLAVSSVAARDAALEAGAAAFLQKPLEPLQLVSAVKDLLGKSAYLREVVPAK